MKRTTTDMDRSAAMVVITPPVEIDLSTTAAFEQDLDGALTTGARLILVDFAGVVFCDAAGLRTLAKAVRSARRVGSDLRIDSPTPQLRKLARLSGATELLGLQ